MGLKIPKPVSSRFGGETMDDAEGVSLLPQPLPTHTCRIKLHLCQPKDMFSSVAVGLGRC